MMSVKLSKSFRLSNKLIVIIGMIAIIGGIGTYYAKTPHVIPAAASAIDVILWSNLYSTYILTWMLLLTVRIF
jgi:hypothetical protein